MPRAESFIQGLHISSSREISGRPRSLTHRFTFGFSLFGLRAGSCAKHSTNPIPTPYLLPRTQIQSPPFPRPSLTTLITVEHRMPTGCPDRAPSFRRRTVVVQADLTLLAAPLLASLVNLAGEDRGIPKACVRSALSGFTLACPSTIHACPRPKGQSSSRRRIHDARAAVPSVYVSPLAATKVVTPELVARPRAPSAPPRPPAPHPCALFALWPLPIDRAPYVRPPLLSPPEAGPAVRPAAIAAAAAVTAAACVAGPHRPRCYCRAAQSPPW